jgi:glucokinase-like ROK family protein
MNRQVTADQNFVRHVNTRTVMDRIRLDAPLSRAEVSARTGLNRSTISSIVGELIVRGYVQETTLQDPKIGRPGMLLKFNPNGGCAVGIEIGVEFISIILTNFVADVLWRHRISMVEEASQFEIIEQAEKLIEEAISIGKEQGLSLLGIGVGVPGLVDQSQGKLVFAPNLKLSNIPLRPIWTQRFNTPVFVENEANSAALGEYFFGAAHGKGDFIYMSTGVGLGGGIMIGGQLFKGGNGYAGEIGHTIIYAGGEECGCGSRGCWETYVGPRAIVRRIRQTINAGATSIIPELVEGDMQKVTVDLVVEAARRNDSVALTALHEVGVDLGVGISNLINIFNPELVIMGGALSLASPWLLQAIREALKVGVLSPLLEKVNVIPSSLGLDSCVMGAVALVLDDVVREPLFSMYSAY